MSTTYITPVAAQGTARESTRSEGRALRGRAATRRGRWPPEPISTLAILVRIVRYWHKADMS